ncbi:PEP-CTERM sorting domain-containing protein [Kiritimatiellaeota bacterium B1221]|nr:PEP-CTERM sorting domain-containing protein [Kiritimatiellaeota bacterium B1221]
MKPIIFSSLLILSLFIHAALQADVLAEFNFDGSSLASADASTSWTTSDLSNGAGVPMTIVTGPVNEGGGSPDEYVSDDLPAIGMQFSSFNYDDLSASIAANGYFTFTVEPDAGTELTFTDISFKFYKTDGAGATVSASIFSSIDGFSTTSDIIGAGTLVGEGESDASLGRTVVLSGLPSVSTATEFRIYLDDGGAGNNANFMGLDDIILNGTPSVIPEPSSVLLMLGAGLLFVSSTRRRNTK